MSSSNCVCVSRDIRKGIFVFDVAFVLLDKYVVCFRIRGVLRLYSSAPCRSTIYRFFSEYFISSVCATD